MGCMFLNIIWKSYVMFYILGTEPQESDGRGSCGGSVRFGEERCTGI